MSLTGALIFLGLVGAATLFVLHNYRRRELDVSGRAGLAALRVAALAVLLFLVLDPTYSTSDSIGSNGPWILLDGSASMSLPVGNGTAWDGALARAQELAQGGGTLVTFGSSVDLGADETTVAPTASRSELGPALARAAEAGAAEVVVISDLRLHDAADVRALGARIGLDVTFEVVGGEARNAGVASLEVPRALDEGEPFRATARVFAQGAAGETARIDFTADGQVVATTDVVLPDAGREVSVEIELPGTDQEGQVRYAARLSLDGDVYSDDDERVGFAEVDPEAGNLVLISFEPDWEIRFLLPVLERVSGLPARGFLKIRDDRYLSLGSSGAGGTVESAVVERMATGAELLVIQGAHAGDAWVDRALGLVRRSVVLARDEETATSLGIPVGVARPGEWYASPELPGSPLAGELAGAIEAGLPPLSTLMALQGDTSGIVPLNAQLRGSGDSEPALLLRTTNTGARQAVALAEGFWRWGFRDGSPRDAYGRMWSAVTGWLLADEPLAKGPGVRPRQSVGVRDEEITWSAAGLTGREIQLSLSWGDSVVSDTTLTVGESGQFETGVLAAGAYDYSAATTDGEDLWEGRLEVEAWTSEFGPPVASFEDFSRTAEGGIDLPSDRRPWRTLPYPYLLVMGLLTLEWAGRRRMGLR